MKDLSTLDLAFTLIKWRRNLSLFFEDVTGLKTRPFQRDFFLEVQRMEKRNIAVVAGRGIGKTLSMAIVALWYTFVLPLTDPAEPMKVLILAGSLDQANICYSYIVDIITNSNIFSNYLVREPTKARIEFKGGSWIVPRPASEKAVRGWHPDVLIMDEVEKVDRNLIYAALPITATSPFSRQIFSATPPQEALTWIEEIWNDYHLRPEKYSSWCFLNWNAEAYLDEESRQSLMRALPRDVYLREVAGQFYRQQGKVFNIKDLDSCRLENLKQDPSSEEIFAGVDWGFYPSPTAIVVAQRVKKEWRILHSQTFPGERAETVLDAITNICKSFSVRTVYADSTNRHECMRLSERGLDVRPISFKGEKSFMLSNLRMLIEQHLLRYDPQKEQILLGQLVDYTYETKKNDDLVDALMLAVRETPLTEEPVDVLSILKEARLKKEKTRRSFARRNANILVEAMRR